MSVCNKFYNMYQDSSFFINDMKNDYLSWKKSCGSSNSKVKDVSNNNRYYFTEQKSCPSFNNLTTEVKEKISKLIEENEINCYDYCKPGPNNQTCLPDTNKLSSALTNNILPNSSRIFSVFNTDDDLNKRYIYYDSLNIDY